MVLPPTRRRPHDGSHGKQSVPAEIFGKDLNIVQNMARATRFPVPVAAATLQMYLATAGAGMGRDDDSALARTHAAPSGATPPPGTKP